MKTLRESQSFTGSVMTDAARGSLAASVGLLLVSTIGCMVNQLAPDAPCDKGLAVVGGSYFIIRLD